jgi:hypothetical protein
MLNAISGGCFVREEVEAEQIVDWLIIASACIVTVFNYTISRHFSQHNSFQSLPCSGIPCDPYLPSPSSIGASSGSSCRMTSIKP